MPDPALVTAQMAWGTLTHWPALLRFAGAAVALLGFKLNLAGTIPPALGFSRVFY